MRIFFSKCLFYIGAYLIYNVVLVSEVQQSDAVLFFHLFCISWRLITLQYCSGFCHTLARISHGFTCVPHPDPLPTSLSTPSVWVFPVHQPWALVSCIQPGLVVCFTLDSNLFQCYSLRSSHPHLLPQSLKVYSVHVCLFFCFAYRVIVTIFLKFHICISILYWSLSFWLTSLCITGSSFIHLIRTDSNEFFLMAE